MPDWTKLPPDVKGFQLMYQDGELALAGELPVRCAISQELWLAVQVRDMGRPEGVIDRLMVQTWVAATEKQFTVRHTRGTFTYEKESDTPHAGQFWLCRLVSREDTPK